MNKILVVGGAGYIGGILTDYLSENNEVAVIDNLLYEDRYLKNISFYNEDIRNLKSLEKIVNKYDTVIFLAGLVGDAACAVNAQNTYDINVTPVKWLADSYKGKIIFPSTCSVYGKNDNLIDETAEPNPLSLYAETKLVAEQYLNKTRPDSLIFRLGTLYGLADTVSRPRLDLVVNVLTMKAALGETLTVFGGEQWRPLLHVKDVANGMIYGMNYNLQGIYNLSQKNYTIKQVAEEILTIVPAAKVSYTDIPFEDKRNYKVSNDKILSKGWLPKEDLVFGIQQMYNLFKENRVKNPYDPVFHNGNYLKKIWTN